LLLTTSWIAPAFAAGEFEAALREEFVRGYLSKAEELTNETPSRPQVEARAKCFTNYVLEVFSPEERAALDVATRDKGTIAKPLTSKLLKRYLEVAAIGVPCSEPATDGPGAG
jgi:hypothetical protein